MIASIVFLSNDNNDDNIPLFGLENSTLKEWPKAM
jgi:hypothetical protein